jgi:hypothetical protein
MVLTDGLGKLGSAMSWRRWDDPVADPSSPGSRLIKNAAFYYRVCVCASLFLSYYFYNSYQRRGLSIDDAVVAAPRCVVLEMMGVEGLVDADAAAATDNVAKLYANRSCAFTEVVDAIVIIDETSSCSKIKSSSPSSSLLSFVMGVVLVLVLVVVLLVFVFVVGCSNSTSTSGDRATTPPRSTLTAPCAGCTNIDDDGVGGGTRYPTGMILRSDGEDVYEEASDEVARGDTAQATRSVASAAIVVIDDDDNDDDFKLAAVIALGDRACSSENDDDACDSVDNRGEDDDDDDGTAGCCCCCCC